MRVMEKEKLLGMTFDELKAVATEVGLPSFAAKQMAEWIYGKHVRSIDEMTNLSLKGRSALAEHYEIGCVPPCDSQQSIDGTAKYLFPTESGQKVECVFIPDGDRATLCVSSQVGCRMGCRFCMTGRQGFGGNLSVTDILNQVYSVPGSELLTNIVFMGQGEPLDNLDAVLKATQLLTDANGWAWSPKRITVSTVGIRKGVERFLNESDCHLAISLHNPFHEERLAMMPAEKANDTRELLELLSKQDWSHQRRLSFEYIVFGGLNDSERHAKELVRLLSPIECNLTKHGVTTTIRASRGQDIFAACGLLHAKSKTEIKKQ